MLTVMARHIAAKDRAQKALAKGVDLVEHKGGTGPGSENCQGTGASRGLQNGLALADRSRPHSQGGKWHWRGKLLQPDLLL